MIPNAVNSICFTGHRQLSSQEIIMLNGKLSRLLSDLACRGLRDCYAGGALGLDTLAALEVIKARVTFPELKLHLIIPCQGQESSWNDLQKQTYREIMSQADEVRVLSPVFYNGCMQMRNKEMLKLSDLCVAYLRAGTSGGGSLNTVLQAAKIGIPVVNLADAESEYLK